MLRHAAEFAQRHEILGAASESQIESFHSAFNYLYNFQHRNTLHVRLEQLRRCLADSVVGVVGPLLAGSLAEPAKSLPALSAPPAAANAP
jgi:RNA processing factor Prp31